MSSKLTSTLVTESAVINAPVSKVWSLIQLRNFQNFFVGINKTEILSSKDSQSEVIRWTFDDGTVLDVREEEYSNIKNRMSFHIVQCQPWGIPYTNVLSTIRLYPITSRAAVGGTFVQWSGHYTADANEEAVNDGRIKRREALGFLADAVEKN
ncbi:hypothetical protein MCOR25_004360 [Pyricularia grisea]|uniref:Bet v1-like protein n=1 Tax=Pyricularia grisea TaxID=148305 RepID=A0A6P8BKK1_PYRGI|nr:uncharacterized protein PgNI_02215 [Pyricularia grisea]KAI6369731.1 hypothetical protein MCOR25_004360 [Pyricularia grisea]TLD17421.1 hypothetical protein PgNI_02215 [Pyricularia grisea]